MGTSPNSAIICRHTPHGVVNTVLSWSATTANVVNFFLPSDTARAIADVSAQTPAGKHAFSTLQPREMLPSAHRIAAPTLNLLYGEYEFSRTATLALISSCIFASTKDMFVIKLIASQSLFPELRIQELIIIFSKYKSHKRCATRCINKYKCINILYHSI